MRQVTVGNFWYSGGLVLLASVWLLKRSDQYFVYIKAGWSMSSIWSTQVHFRDVAESYTVRFDTVSSILTSVQYTATFKTLRSGQNGRFIADDSFRCICFTDNVFILHDQNFVWILFLDVYLTQVIIDLGNGLVPNRWQAIFFTNTNLVYPRIYEVTRP